MPLDHLQVNYLCFVHTKDHTNWYIITDPCSNSGACRTPISGAMVCTNPASSTDMEYTCNYNCPDPSHYLMDYSRGNRYIFQCAGKFVPNSMGVQKKISTGCLVCPVSYRCSIGG